MNLRDKWGDEYRGFMLITGGYINLTHDQATTAMMIIDKAYQHDNEAFLKALELFKKDVKEEDVQTRETPHPIMVKRPTTTGVGGKLQAIWQGYS